MSVICATGLLALVVAIDALHLYSAWPPPEADASFVEGLPVVGVLFLVSAALLVVGTRPAVRLTEGGIWVRNPLRTYELPWPAVLDVDGGDRYVRLRTDDLRITVMAVERWTVDAASGAGVPEALRTRWEQERWTGRPGARVRTALTRPHRIEVVVLGAWLAYAVSALVTTATGISPAPLA